MDRALAAAVRQRARRRCEYCGLPESESGLPFAIDHIIARQHEGNTVFENLALACAHCNLNKGPNVSGVDPVNKVPATLFNPRSDQWKNHFRWDGLRIVGQTSTGRATVLILKMNSAAQLGVRLSLLRSGWFLTELS